MAVSPGDPPAVDDEIVAYLAGHPEATDSLDGIVSWWLPRQRYEQTRERIQAALDRLVAQGVVERIHLADGSVVDRRSRTEDA